MTFYRSSKPLYFLQKNQTTLVEIAAVYLKEIDFIFIIIFSITVYLKSGTLIEKCVSHGSLFESNFGWKMTCN